MRGDFKREMERAKSFGEIALGAIPQVANFWFLAEEPKCRELHRGNLLYPRKSSLALEKSPGDRHPICAKMETQKLLNAPLHAFAASCAATHGWGGAYSASWIWTRFLHPEMRKPFFAMDPCYPGHLYMIAFSWTCGMVVSGVAFCRKIGFVVEIFH